MVATDIASLREFVRRADNPEPGKPALNASVVALARELLAARDALMSAPYAGGLDYARAPLGDCVAYLASNAMHTCDLLSTATRELDAAKADIAAVRRVFGGSK